MTTQTLIAELNNRGIVLAIKNGKLLSKPVIPADLIPALKKNKDAIIDALQTQRLQAALVYLKCREISAIRLYSKICGGQLLILRDDTIRDRVTAPYPIFTLKELKMLIGSSRKHVKAVYLIKQEFRATVES